MMVIKDLDGNVLVRLPRILKQAKIVHIETSPVNRMGLIVRYRLLYRQNDGIRIETLKDGEDTWKPTSPDYPAYTPDVCAKLIKLFRRSSRQFDHKVKFVWKIGEW